MVQDNGKSRVYFLDNLMAFIIFLLNLIFNPGQFILSGTMNVVLTWLAFHLSLLGMMYIVINTFRYYMNQSVIF